MKIMLFALFSSMISAQSIAPSWGGIQPGQQISTPARIRRHHAESTQAGAVDTQNWSGYAITSTTGSVTEVIGSWVVPSVDCTTGPATAFASFWLGIDGFKSSTVEQIGTDSDCWDGVPAYYVWYEFYPSQLVSVPVFDLVINPGHVVSAKVKYVDGQFTVSITNLFTGQSFSTTQAITTATRSSAEWIAEAPSNAAQGLLPLANFRTIRFGYGQTGVLDTCGATIDGTMAPIGSFGAKVLAVTMVSSNNVTCTPTDVAKPAPLLRDGSSFSIRQPLSTEY
jgi:hypothetical protein